MAHSSPPAGPAGPLDPAVVGRVLTRLGLGILALTVPVAAGAGAGLVVNTDSPATVALAALESPLLGGSGLPWLFHLAVLALLGGCWLLGAGLVLDGLFD